MSWIVALLAAVGLVVPAGNVTVTAYTSSPKECDASPWVTASGWKLKEGDRIVAVSRDLEKVAPMGSWVFLEGMGWFRVEDRMNKRWRRRVDVWFGRDREGALAFGKRKARVWIFKVKQVEPLQLATDARP